MSEIIFTLEGQASEANRWFTRDKRNDGKEFVKVKDGAPEWVTSLCRAAHNNANIWPNDWRYEFIEDALTALENGDEDCPDLDDKYPYTASRLQWLSSHLDRPGRCDEANEEYGGEVKGITDLIGLGMQHEMREVFDCVKAWLKKHIEELEEEHEASVEASNDADAAQEAGGSE